MEINEDIKIGSLDDDTPRGSSQPEDQATIREVRKYDEYLESIGIDRGNLKSDKQRAEELHAWLEANGIKRLPPNHFGYRLLESQGFDPTNINSTEASASKGGSR